MPNAHDILGQKGFSIHTVSPTSTVLDAVVRMNQLRVGAVVVMNQGDFVGMFTERDVLRRVVGERRDPATTKVNEAMTTEVIFCSPSTDIDEISAIMKNRRIRHLPVRDKDGELLGLISIGDVNAIHASNQQAHLSYLNEYVYGRA
jgi:CBS domain-containing protein